MASIDSIAPFRLVHHEQTRKYAVELTVGEYKQEVFDDADDHAFEGSGYDWVALAKVYLDEQAPDLKDAINFAPVADKFTAFADDRASVEEFATGFRAACEDDVALRGMLSRATVDD